MLGFVFHERKQMRPRFYLLDYPTFLAHFADSLNSVVFICGQNFTMRLELREIDFIP